jgi:hypothetical protein
MFRLILLFIIFVSNPSHADQGLNITCLNMKSILGRKYEPLQFKLETMGFHYFDKKHDKFLMIKANKLEIGENFFTADYELGFQLILFKDSKGPTITMSKYDYKNKVFLEHYTCDAESSYIE